MLGFVAIASWTTITSFILLKSIDFFVPLRMPLEEELLGSDLVEHGLGNVPHIKGRVTGRSIEEALGQSEVIGHTSGCDVTTPPRQRRRHVSISHQGAFGAKYKESDENQATSLFKKAVSTTMAARTFRRGQSSTSGNADPPHSSDNGVDTSMQRRRQSRRGSGKIFSNILRRKRQSKQFTLSKALSSIHRQSAGTLANGVGNIRAISMSHSATAHGSGMPIDESNYAKDYKYEYSSAGDLAYTTDNYL